mmetsp:Transcript_12522/g.33645  ORF Transcript_12522/g.33645 Transcript_12522/m.33645 type:complete len:365 (+) Transcript_12522:162-1256(+)
MLMKTLLEAAFRPPPKASRAKNDPRFAILPQQSEDELVLSEVHSKLDYALSWLQREIGYSLLDDARPWPGGGVSLERCPPDVPEAPKGSRSHKIPKDGKKRVIKEGETPAVTDEITRQVIRFRPDTAKYAHFPDDLVLVWRFANVLGATSPAALAKVKHEQLYKTVLQGIRLMHLCDYHYSDVVVTLAYASVYFRRIFNEIGHKMSDYEAAHVSVLLIYLAHCFVLDETCPLRCWQKYIFRKYCSLKVLDAALFQLFDMKDYVLRITVAEEKQALEALLASNSEVDVILSSCGERNHGTAANNAASKSETKAAAQHVTQRPSPPQAPPQAQASGDRGPTSKRSGTVVYNGNGQHAYHGGTNGYV